MNRIHKPANAFSTAPLAERFAADANGNVSMNWSEFAGSVPNEVDGENAKEGCMAELLFPVCHQLWPMAA